MADAENDPDLSHFTAKFADVRRERDVLRSQNHDLEVNLKVAESKVENLTAELDKTKAQLDSLRATVVEKETIIQSIAAAILTHIKKEPGITGIPVRPGNSVREGLRALGKPQGEPNERHTDGSPPVGGDH